MESQETKIRRNVRWWADQELISLAFQTHSLKWLEELSGPLNDLLEASSFQKLPPPLKTGKPFQGRNGYRKWINSLPKECRPQRHDDLFEEVRKHSAAWNDFLDEMRSLPEPGKSILNNRSVKSNVEKANDRSRRIGLKLEDIVIILSYGGVLTEKKLLDTLGGRESEFRKALHLGIKLGLIKRERKNRLFYYSLIPYEELSQEGQMVVHLAALRDRYRGYVSHSKQAPGLRSYYPARREKKRKRFRCESFLENWKQL